jgi:LysM repeat protein
VTLPLVTNGFTSQNKPTPLVSGESGTVKTVVVLHTDTLIGFARSIEVAWHVLAELNNLSPMHVLHPGEILKIK